MKKVIDFTWKCPEGHTGEVPAGSPLELRVYERAAQGLGATIEIPVEECPDCLSLKLATIIDELDTCQNAGCQVDEGECHTCLPKIYREVAALRDASRVLFGEKVVTPAAQPDYFPSGLDLAEAGLKVRAM